MTMLPERLPAALSERLASAGQSIYNRQGREVDIAIGGIPFLLANYPDLPKTVETVPIRKDQFDTERDPGEQSLSSWWRRSQSSFHEGAGYLYAENNDGSAGFGFWDSEGVSVFEQGQITLLKRMDSESNPAATYSRLRVYYSGGAPAKSAVGSGAFYTSSTWDGTLASLHAPATKTIVDGLVSGSQFYDVASDGTLYSGTLASPDTATTWPCGATPSRMAWGKHRLWMIGGTKIWQPDLALAGGTAQNPIYTHPSPGWTYTCLADSPAAMLFGGNDGNFSTIQGITLDSSGGLPTLSGATVVTTLPEGELVQEIAVLAGTYVGIGTSRGFRVGVLDSNGTITYGPLLVEPTGVTACTALTTQDRFFVVAFATSDNRSLAYRVDTSTEVSDGVFPYAKDVDCGTNGAITSLAAPRTDALLATVTAGTVYHQSLTNYVATGYIQSGRIRYRTTEHKAFKFLNLEIEPLNGTINATLVQEGGGSLSLGSLNVQGQTADDAFGIDLEPMRYASVKLDLLANGAATAAPVVNSYLLKALPVVPPQRQITLPLMCFDLEQGKTGQRYGATGYANDRLMALQILEDSAQTVVFQDFAFSGNSGQIVTIESIRFAQNSSAGPEQPKKVGGILVVQLRTVA